MKLNILKKNYGSAMHEIHAFLYGFGNESELESEPNNIEWFLLNEMVYLLLHAILH